MSEFLYPNLDALDFNPEEHDRDALRDMYDLVNESKEVAQDPVERLLLSDILAYMSPEGPDRQPGILAGPLIELMAYRRGAGLSTEAGYMARLLEFSLDLQLRELFPGVYPGGISRAWWYQTDPLRHIDVIALQEEMAVNNLQSNMADAYSIYHLLSTALKDRWQGPINVLDVGISLGLGDRKWLSGTFRAPSIYLPPKRDVPLAIDVLAPDRGAQETVNRLNTEQPYVNKIVGIDWLPVSSHNEKVKRRVFSHTFPMLEALKRPTEVNDFNRLLDGQYDNLYIPKLYTDARNPQDLAAAMERLSQEDILSEEQFEVAIISATLFENSPEAAAAIIENLKPYVKDYIFIADFAEEDASEPGGLRFIRRNWWHRQGHFALFAIDLKNGDGLPHEVARFLTRHGTEMWLSPYGKELLSVDEAKS